MFTKCVPCIYYVQNKLSRGGGSKKNIDENVSFMLFSPNSSSINNRFTDSDFLVLDCLGGGMQDKVDGAKRAVEINPQLHNLIDDHCLPKTALNSGSVRRVGPHPDDVTQGQLGDCYYLSAV